MNYLQSEPFCRYISRSITILRISRVIVNFGGIGTIFPKLNPVIIIKVD